MSDNVIIKVKGDYASRQLNFDISVNVNDIVESEIDEYQLTHLKDTIQNGDKVELLRTLTRIVEKLVNKFESTKTGEPNGKS